MNSKYQITFFVCLCALLVSCDRKEEIVYYEVPKEELKLDTTLASHGHSDEGGEHHHEAQSSLSWDVPEAWREGKSSSMRLGSYTSSDPSEVDIAVTKFPGDVGGLFSNVNRWRGQIGLGQLASASDLKDYVVPLKTDHLEFDLVSLENFGEERLKTYVGVLNRGGETWFFKITGDHKKVSAQRENFIDFLLTVREEEATD
ncbi:MAG: hypothetical protein MI748_10730 [Opitutales bacterium]|nr:hypothetical protein [Opitutales bacterium]